MTNRHDRPEPLQGEVITSRGVDSRRHVSRHRTAWDMTKLMSKTVLHADDSASVRRWVAEQLGDMDLKVISVADGEAALKVLRESPCDLLLDRPGDAQPRRAVAGRRRSRPADASFLAGSRPVVPAAHGVSAGEPARSDGLAGQADRARPVAALGSAGLAALSVQSWTRAIVRDW